MEEEVNDCHSLDWPLLIMIMETLIGLSWSPLIFWSSFILYTQHLDCLGIYFVFSHHESWLQRSPLFICLCLSLFKCDLKNKTKTHLLFVFKAKPDSSFDSSFLIDLILETHIWGPKYPSGFLSLNGHRQWLGDSGPVGLPRITVEANSIAVPKALNYFCGDITW